MSAPLEVLVVGGGIAGMTYATQLVDLAGERRVQVRILSKAIVQVSNSFAAQGGVAAVLRSGDSFEQHVKDTLTVGAGRNDPEVVRLVVREGPAMIRGLIGLGARFDAGADGRLDLAREGGHSQARVVHHRDTTGAEIVRVLQQRVKASSSIEVVEDQRVIDLLLDGPAEERRCIGVRMLDLRTGALMDRYAPVVVLATGGAGQVYQHTTNPVGATGDGIAMAVRAGVPVRDMAFVQFHPTALHTGDLGPSFLISEAVRGAGAKLLRADGGSLMKGVHPMGDLAPRNVVARAIHQEMGRSGSPHVWLDASPIGVARFMHEFPAIDAHCRKHGLTPGRDLLPVMPAAHYMCGGVVIDDRGRTALAGLYALGECASSGLHGADRLASNSLLEALVLPKRAAHDTLQGSSDHPHADDVIITCDKLSTRVNEALPRGIAALKHVMSKHVGIVRDAESMQFALHLIAREERLVAQLWSRKRWSRELLDLRDLLAVARSISESALAEPLSLGGHFRRDAFDRDGSTAA